MRNLLLFTILLIIIGSCDPPNNKNTDQLFNAKTKKYIFPSANLQTVSHETVNILDIIKSNQEQNKITLVCFWATWCGPCSLEFNEIKKYYSTWQSKYNLEILAISIDEPDLVKNLSAYVERKQWPYTILYDTDKKLSQGLKINNIPKSYLFDKKGKIVHVNSYYYEGIADEIQAMLKQL